MTRDEARRIAANIAKLPELSLGTAKDHALHGRLEPVIHATAHNILDQRESPWPNRLVVEVGVQQTHSADWAAAWRMYLSWLLERRSR